MIKIIEKSLKYVYVSRNTKVIFRVEDNDNLCNIMMNLNTNKVAEFDFMSRCGI